MQTNKIHENEQYLIGQCSPEFHNKFQDNNSLSFVKQKITPGQSTNESSRIGYESFQFKNVDEIYKEKSYNYHVELEIDAEDAFDYEDAKKAKFKNDDLQALLSFELSKSIF